MTPVHVCTPQAEVYADEYQEMLEFTLKWTDKAKSLLKASVIWSSASHLQEQIRMYQVRPQPFSLSE